MHVCLQAILSKHKNSLPTILLVGDFNFPNINWLDSSTLPTPSLGSDFVDVLDCFSLEQLVKDKTRYHNVDSGNILDLVLCNFPGKISKLLITDLFSDHSCIIFNVALNIPRSDLLAKRKIKLFNKTNFDKMKQDARMFSQTFINDHSNFSVEINWCKFKNFIISLTDKYVPTKILKNSYKTWVTIEDRKLINKRNRLAKKAKKSQNPIHRQRYCKFRNYVTKKLNISRNSYVSKLIDNITTNVRPFYRYVNSNKIDTNGIPPLLDNNIEITNDTAKSNIFNNYFSSVFSRSHSNIPPISSHNPNIDNLFISAHGVQVLLSKLDVTKSTGPDEIPTRILVELHQEISPALAVIFTQSLNTGCLPEDWT